MSPEKIRAYIGFDSLEIVPFEVILFAPVVRGMVLGSVIENIVPFPKILCFRAHRPTCTVLPSVLEFFDFRYRLGQSGGIGEDNGALLDKDWLDKFDPLGQFGAFLILRSLVYLNSELPLILVSTVLSLFINCIFSPVFSEKEIPASRGNPQHPRHIHPAGPSEYRQLKSEVVWRWASF